MKAGDKVIWTDRGHGGVNRECKIIAIFKIEDAINKKVVGRTIYRIDVCGCDVHVFEDEIRPIE